VLTCGADHEYRAAAQQLPHLGASGHGHTLAKGAPGIRVGYSRPLENEARLGAEKILSAIAGFVEKRRGQAAARTV
jgi:hypothetical protein